MSRRRRSRHVFREPPPRPRRLRALLLALLLAVLPHVPAQAADAVQVRAALQSNFAHIAFDWPEPVAFETQRDGDRLTIRFARPLAAKFDVLLARLKDYVAEASLADDGTAVTLRLARPVRVKAFTAHGKTVVVNLLEQPETAAKPAEPAKKKAKPVAMRVESKDGTTRVTLRWPTAVDYQFIYQFTAAGETARMAFQRPGMIDAARLAAALPLLAPRLEAADGGPVIAFTVPEGVQLKHAQSGRDIVLEVSGKPAASDPPGPAPEIAVATPPPPAAAPPAPPAAAAPAAAAAPPPGGLPVHFIADGDAASLRVDWPAPTPAAVFRRGPAVWIVFGTPTRLELAELRGTGRSVVADAEQIPDPDATVLRVLTRDGINPSVRRSGASWIVDLKAQAAQAEAPVAVEVHAHQRPPEILFRVRQAGEAIRLRDPEAGDALLIVPVGELGRGIGALQGFVDFSALPSVQGLVIRANVEDLALRSGDDGVTVTRSGGLVLSSERDRILGGAPENVHRLFDFAGWRGDDAFLHRRSVLEQAVASVPLAARSKPRLDLARFYFAHLFGAEALGVLAAIARDDPEMAASLDFRALKGGACMLEHDLGCAGDEFGLKGFDAEPEAALWRASIAAERGDWRAAAGSFARSIGMLPSYPEPLRSRLMLQAADAMLQTDQAALAGAIIDLVAERPSDETGKAGALYLQGRLEEQAGRLDRALDSWKEVADMGDRFNRARARYAMAVAQFDAGRANREDTIKTLDGLAFAWRGDAFEFELLQRLSELKRTAGDYRGGLEAARDAVANFPDQPAAKTLMQQSVDSLADIFLGKGAEDVPPLKALALYDEFHDLLPAGERSDMVVRRLADRLVAVDLLGRAADLLDDQVAHRLTGLDKARVATQVALLRLLDHNPDAAIKALDVDVGSVPPELGRQRQQLRARGLLDLGRSADALAVLGDDDSRDADRLRADIYWRDHNWAEAIKVFERLAAPPGADGKLDPETAHLVLNWAAALTLAGDREGLARLRQTYAQAIAGTPAGDMFRVIADDGGDPKAPGARRDLRQAARQMAQIGELQSFIASYRKRLTAEKLSAIN
jgi:hypothetical protein